MTLINEALDYANNGFEIFPLKPNKTPYVSQYKATTNPETVAQWWTKHPDALIGHRVAPGTVLLDIDPRHNGLETWAAVTDRIDIPVTRCHYSGRDDGGFHLWFNWPLEENDLTEATLLELAKQWGTAVELFDDDGKPVGWSCGIDILRNHHRYTILPPSPHPVTGRPYTWGATTPVADCPVDLIDMLTAPAEPVSAPRIDLGAGLPSTRTLELAPIESPADWYSATATWSDLLGRNGWTINRGNGDDDGTQWRRPGSDNPWSATIKHGCLFVYSSSTVFEVTTADRPHGYTRFEALSMLEHGGDRSAAAHHVYTLPGAPTKPEKRPTTPTLAAPLITPQIDLNPAEADDQREQLSTLIVDGADFIFNVQKLPAVWGQGQEILWAEGEPFLVCGGIGAGKTTLTNQLVKARLGLSDSVLGWPVKPTDARVLYLASDRPSQIARAMGRIYTDDHAPTLKERLRVVKGPPPADLAQQPSILLELARTAEADTVFLDSLKDMAGSLSSEDVGAGLNKAMQLCVANGVEVVANHHGRKATGDNPKPNKLADVYGSTWITSGAGSVIYLHGNPGGTEIEVLHLKQPMDDMGPFKITHDHDIGVSVRIDQWDPLQWLQHTTWPAGITAKAAAKAQTKSDTPNDSQMRRARRHLERLFEAGYLELIDSEGKTKIYQTTDKITNVRTSK